MSNPNYYAVIPAHVRYCKEITPIARLLYGEITALCSKEGYCWASNRYFSELYDVDERTVRRWIQSLKENNFIHVEIENEQKNSQRKIWIKESYTPDKNVQGGGQSCPGGGTKMSAIIEQENNTKEHTVCSEGGLSPPSRSENLSEENKKSETQIPSKLTKSTMFKTEVSISLEEVFYRAIKERLDFSTSEIEKAWEILYNYKSHVNDLFQFISGTIQKLRRHKQNEVIDNKKGRSSCHKRKEKLNESKQKSSDHPSEVQLCQMSFLNPNIKRPFQLG